MRDNASARKARRASSGAATVRGRGERHELGDGPPRTAGSMAASARAMTLSTRSRSLEETAVSRKLESTPSRRRAFDVSAVGRVFPRSIGDVLLGEAVAGESVCVSCERCGAADAPTERGRRDGLGAGECGLSCKGTTVNYTSQNTHNLLELSHLGYSQTRSAFLPDARQEGCGRRAIPGDTNPEASAGPQSRSLRVVAILKAEHVPSVGSRAGSVDPSKAYA